MLPLALVLAVALAGCTSPPTGSQNGSSTPAARGAMASATNSAASHEISFKTADGWTIVGDLYAPQGKSKGGIVLLHQRGGSAKDWQPLCLALRKAGFTALAIDQRGAGRSTQGPGPTGDDAPWDTSGDIAAAITQLPKNVSIGLAGASYGANNALIYAAAHSDQIKGIALFSPGANYHGLDALTPARSYRGSVVIYHDKGDSIAGDGPQQINQALPSTDHTLHVYDGDQHGTNLIDPGVIKDAVAFFQRVLKSP